ncbi:hypothetical protein [Corallococcus macrosporus]|uniref:hypothetical protein n=1 Tax=Corallococcus macrosporus TaxID=35 RepID=UPI000F4D76F1|nr:hypothetical protein [Corallococcus macrosporus]
MAGITRSAKLIVAEQVDQSKMGSGRYVLVRILHEGDSYTLMTATAKEDDGSYLAYPDLERLVVVAEDVVGHGERHSDNWGRPYFLRRGIEHPREIRYLANNIAEELGLKPVDERWADEEKREIYDEFSVGEDDEPAYLSDGVYITKRGRLLK